MGVYLDVIPPAGCTPSGRILQTSVVLAARGLPGDLANVFADSYPGDPTPGDGMVTFSCTNQAAAVGLTYTLVAVVDAHANDLATCGPGALLSLACFEALADDDGDSGDNRLTRSAPRVQPP